MSEKIGEFIIPEGVYITLDSKQYITIPAATKIIRQRFPAYQKENLYAASRKLGLDGKVLLNTIKYEFPGITTRLLIPRGDFEAWLVKPDLGKMSVPHGGYKRKSKA